MRHLTIGDLFTIAAACWSPFLIALGFSRVQRRDDWDRLAARDRKAGR